MSDFPIGFIGLGRMGSEMAGRLIEAGHQLLVYDTNQAATAAITGRGAVGAGSVAEIADRAETIFASLPTPDIVRKVAIGEGGVAGGGKARIFVDLSTTGPRTAQAVAQGLAAHGITAVDAPVSGGVTGARKGKLTIMVSGPAEARAAVEPLLAAFGRTMVIGDKAGMAQTMKLANNLVAATSLAVTCEAVTMGRKAGLDPKVMVDVMNVSSGRSSATDDKFPRAILPRTFDFGFATGLSYKDVRLCLEEAEALGVSMVVGSATRQLLVITSSLFGPESDFTSMIRSVEQLSGVEDAD